VLRRWGRRLVSLDRRGSGCGGALPGRLLEITYESVFKRRGAAGLDQARRGIRGEDMPGIHQRYPIAALRLVHEVCGDENGYFLIARQIDQNFPKPVPRQRIDSRGRLVENQDLRLVDDGDGQGYPLSNPQRQIEGPLIE
jgi:hypothetical protein